MLIHQNLNLLWDCVPNPLKGPAHPCQLVWQESWSFQDKEGASRPSSMTVWYAPSCQATSVMPLDSATWSCGGVDSMRSWDFSTVNALILGELRASSLSRDPFHYTNTHNLHLYWVGFAKLHQELLCSVLTNRADIASVWTKTVSGKHTCNYSPQGIPLTCMRWLKGVKLCVYI